MFNYIIPDMKPEESLAYYAAHCVLKAFGMKKPETELVRTKHENYIRLTKNYSDSMISLADVYPIKDAETIFDQLHIINEKTKGTDVDFFITFVYQVIGCYLVDARMPKMANIKYYVNEKFNLCSYGFYDHFGAFKEKSYMTHNIDLEGFLLKLINEFPSAIFVILNFYRTLQENEDAMYSALYENIFCLDAKMHDIFKKTLSAQIKGFKEFVDINLPAHDNFGNILKESGDVTYFDWVNHYAKWHESYVPNDYYAIFRNAYLKDKKSK